jgi:hypothetical protein
MGRPFFGYSNQAVELESKSAVVEMLGNVEIPLLRDVKGVAF